MTVTKQRISSIIKEELTRARRMNEMMDGPYNDDLQSRHGRFTTPENVMGTPQHREMHRGPSVPSFSQVAPRGSAMGGGNDYSEYDSMHYGPGINEVDEDDYINEADDEMDTDGDDMGIDVVADDAAPEDDMGGEDMMTSEMEAEIDWSQFDDLDGDAVGAAFMDAIKLLRDEQPEETPTAAAVVERMQEILMGDSDGEADDNAFSDDPAPLAESVDWRRRAGLLAGITKRY
jgi:hypothetical protein